MKPETTNAVKFCMILIAGVLAISLIGTAFPQVSDAPTIEQPVPEQPVYGVVSVEWRDSGSTGGMIFLQGGE